MTEREAILGFTMGERLKAALIAGNTLVQLLDGMTGEERRGAEKLFLAYLRIALKDVSLARRMAPRQEWDAVEKSLETGLTMAESGVVVEAMHHMTQALSHTTTVSNRTMTFLKEKDLL